MESRNNGISEEQIQALGELALSKQAAIADASIPIKPHPTCPHLQAERKWGKIGNLSARKQGILSAIGEEFTEEEVAAIKLPHESKDQLYLRYLRGSNFKLGESVTALRKSINWRREFKMDRLKYLNTSQLTEGAVDLQYLVSQYPVGVAGHGRCGRPIYFKLYGRMNPPEVEKLISAKQAAIWETCNTEKITYMCAVNSAKLGYHVEDSIVIIDLKHLSGYTVFSTYVKNVMKYCSEFLDANYPETLGW